MHASYHTVSIALLCDTQMQYSMQVLVVCFPGKNLHALNSYQYGELSYKAV